ncbi:hypothetical protein BGZ99_001325, partial [Dissophora globulifera]
DNDNDVELALLGQAKKPNGDQLQEILSSPTVLEKLSVYRKKDCESYPQLAWM